MKQHIVCAAIKYSCQEESILVLGSRHYDNVMRKTLELLGFENGCFNGKYFQEEQGFVDQFGNFLNRVEAYKIAKENGQIARSIGYETTKLYSEHLY